MSIAKNSKSNPLICKIEYAFPDDILTMENVELNQVDITMKGSKVFNELYGTPSSHTFSEPSDVSAAGLLFKQKLSVYYPGIEVLSHSQLVLLERTPAIYKITYQHGLVQVIGSMDVPARLFFSLSASDSTGINISIACDSDERARFLVIE